MPKKEKSEKTVTGSSRTTTGNIRTVRLNTYRERKNEALQLELENEQESFLTNIQSNENIQIVLKSETKLLIRFVLLGLNKVSLTREDRKGFNLWPS